MFGYDLTDVPDGRAWCKLAYPDPEYRHTVVATWLNDVALFKKDRSLKEGKHWTFSVRCKNGEEKIINFIPVRLNNGKYLITYEDITEIKKLQAEVLQWQKIEAIGTLAGGIAHDFNNLITALMGYTSLIKKKLRNEDPLQYYVDQVLMATEKAAGLSRSLLAFSRKQAINPRAIDPNDVIQKMHKLLARLIGEDIELLVLRDDRKITIMADETQFEQVVINLATNARDAMPNGGLLTIALTVCAIDEIFVKSHGYGEVGQYALITVSDTGYGFDENIKEIIFEPFFTTKKAGRGTGLGLSIVYGIVKKHNGYIDVESKPGKGSTFKIYLPFARPDMKTEKTQIPGHVIEGNETILLAEDDNNVRLITRMFLENYGYRVIEAKDGDDALDRFFENKDSIDLVILDVVMPKKNGKEVFDRIRSTTCKIPVLFTSGYTFDIISEKGINSGSMEFISKPIVPEVLANKVRGILDKKGDRIRLSF